MAKKSRLARRKQGLERANGSHGSSSGGSRRTLLRAGGTFLAIHGILLAIVYFYAKSLFDRYFNPWTARATAWTLWILGADGHANGSTVVSSVSTFAVITECTAVFPILVFFSAVVAYPSSWRNKLMGLVIGTPALILINLARLVSVCYVEHWFPKAAETVHLIVWQTLMVFLTVLCWLSWAVWCGNGDERSPA